MAAKNMFDYNRENFQFDQEHRLSRELLRQILQLKRFSLFRQDIRDLVELTVGKTEMYHLVAALFMESSMALYFEGRIHHVKPTTREFTNPETSHPQNQTPNLYIPPNPPPNPSPQTAPPQDTLLHFEEKVRAAEGKLAAIEAIAQSFGFECP
ncbi:unnamed protein product [Symbiodinium sp. CCMP2592]|nr:unnamed protein product [Symbiodinium sp. CCMP2592]